LQIRAKNSLLPSQWKCKWSGVNWKKNLHLFQHFEIIADIW